MLLKITIRASNLVANVHGEEISLRTFPIERSTPSFKRTLRITTSPAKASDFVSFSKKISSK